MKQAEHNIQFSSLKPGTYEYNYLIEHPFFALFDYSPIKEGRVWVKVMLSKHETMLVLNFNIHGTVNLLCARCNENFDSPIEGTQKLIVKFGEKDIDESDDIAVLPFGEHQLNISQYLYEFIMLCIPLKAIHPLDSSGQSTCNPATLDILEKMSVSRPENQAGDPRWDALKQLKRK